MQNKSILYAVAGVVVVGVIAWAVFGAKGKPVGTGTPAGGSPQAQSSSMSMRDLFARGESQKCTFQGAEGDSSGVMYVTAGKMRGDFTSVAAGTTVQSHMITDGTTAYIWTDQMPQGIKMSYDSIGSQGQSTQSNVDINTALNYDCSPWGVDQSLLNTPSGVTFTDMSSLTGGAGTPTLPSGYTLPRGVTGPDYQPPAGGDNGSIPNIPGYPQY